MSSIYKINLCGRKVYRKYSGGKKYFGKIISDYDFEANFLKDCFDGDSAGSVLVMCDKPEDGWPARISPGIIKFLCQKQIPFSENTGFWYLLKSMIKNGDFDLNERMVIDNE